ncbi:HMG box domain-containing protein [Favolaschia claudopus]|uniref:HMG box domain-containing protein n=1 Tax=Favolaschia claudopus TaxID=2862362 RepID=A0AAW0DYJ4_9AGAR
MAGPTRTSPKSSTVQPPRPPNAWILYRAEKSKTITRKAQADVSKEIAAMWKAELPHVRAEYERRADIKKAEHAAMYPDYRFQPIKREDKERIRDEKKQEKERKKAVRRRGRASPPPVPVPLPAPQPSRHYAPYATNLIPMFDPLAPYYKAEQRYGPSGPTPPLSAAPSPSASVASDLAYSRVEESSTSPSTLASPYPQTPSSVYESPAMPTSSFPTSFASSQSPEPDATKSVQWTEPPSAQRSSPPATSSNWQTGPGGQGPPPAQEFLSFELPNNPPLPSWGGQDAYDIQAILSATGDPSVFELSDFDPQSLLDHPTGQLEVSLGHFDFPGFDDPIPHMADFGHYVPQSYAASTNSTEFGGGMSTLFSPMDPAATTPGDFHTSYDDFLNFDTNISDASASQSVPATEQRSSETTPTRPAYVPPSGAAHTSTRRVGGKWRPPAAESPTGQSPSQLPWGVHA